MTTTRCALLVPLLATILLCMKVATAADPAGKIAPGEIPPPLIGVNANGDEILTTQFAGKVLVVTFWASWCGPCMKELPMLESIQKAAGKTHLQVVAINTEDRESFRKIARALSTLNLQITYDYGKKSSDAYGVNGIPHMLIIGRDGKVLKVHRGYGESALDGIVAELNAALKG